MDKAFTLKKAERLSSKKAIEFLFTKGDSVLVYPFRIAFARVEREEMPVSVLVSVSKKRFKHAVDRNRVKRCCREAYRLNKSILTEPLHDVPFTLHLAFIYVGAKIEEFSFFDSKMKKGLALIKDKLG